MLSLRAAELYQQCLSNQYFSYRDRGYFLSLQAGALALSGEPDRATDTAQQALIVAVQTNSRRTKQELIRVCHLLRPWKSRTVVRDLVSTLAT
jgi:hypothetical protein